MGTMHHRPFSCDLLRRSQTVGPREIVDSRQERKELSHAGSTRPFGFGNPTQIGSTSSLALYRRNSLSKRLLPEEIASFTCGATLRP